METLKLNLKNIEQEIVEKIIISLKRGDICALPSDTSYGLCARADDAEVTDKIYHIKNRSKNNSLSVFVKDLEMIGDIAILNEITKKIITKYLPGSYTFILKKKKIILDNISADKKTIGIRWIQSKLFDEIFNKIDFPITATSANISDQSPIYNPRDLTKIFKNKAIGPDLIVDAGVLDRLIPSTIVDLSSKKPRILRQGAENFIV